MNDWTLFYWGWWIAWCPFVGMFIAKISFGRTVKDFIFGVMAAPVIYVSLWFIMFGGAGLRMEREAANNGLCCHNLEVPGFPKSTEVLQCHKAKTTKNILELHFTIRTKQLCVSFLLQVSLVQQLGLETPLAPVLSGAALCGTEPCSPCSLALLTGISFSFSNSFSLSFFSFPFSISY